MIASITGLIKTKKENWILVEANGLGYKVFVTDRVSDSLRVGDQTFLYTHYHVKEDSQALYGFVSLEEQEFFELLLTISGIGPKIALGVLNATTINDLRAAIIEDDPDILTKISGIGGKTAKRIVLELKNKIVIGDIRPVGTKSLDVGANLDVYEALIRLGYNSVEARAALKMVPENIKNPDEKLKIALKNLGR